MNDKTPMNDKDTPIIPAQDEIASYKQQQARKRFAGLGDVPDVASGSTSTVLKSLVGLLFVVLAAGSVWAYFVQEKLQRAEKALTMYEARISDLEKRLTITDEDVTDSQAAMQVKLKELDFEIRKLWDNVWKKSRERLAAHDAQLASQEKFIGSAKTQLAANQTVIDSLKVQLDKLKGVETTVASTRDKAAAMESRLQTASDQLNKLGAELGTLQKRVTTSEEWIESINAFRRQVNRDINTLKQNQAPGAVPAG